MISEDSYMNIGQKIKHLRKAKGMTLEDVANIVGVGKSTVRKWETGMIANMKRDKISKLAFALGTTPTVLIGWAIEQNGSDIQSNGDPNIGERIKNRRIELGMSADELGSRLGVHRTTVFRYESGYIEKLPVDILEPIAKALQTTPDYFFDWEEVQENNDTLADIIVRMRTDEEFSEIVKTLNGLGPEKLSGIKMFLNTFLK